MGLKMNDYPRTWNNTTRRWVYKHREVGAQLLGRPLRSDEFVHHKDGDPKNFSSDNLVVLSPEEHVRLHKPATKYMGCSIPDCPNPHYSRTYCSEHFSALYPYLKEGDISSPATALDAIVNREDFGGIRVGVQKQACLILAPSLQNRR